MKVLTLLLSLVLAFVAQTTLVIAGEIPGYIGQQSFRLSDDPGLYEYDRRAQDAKVEVARADQVRSQLDSQARQLSQQREEIQARMNQAIKNAEAAKAARAVMATELAELQKNAEANKDAIAAKTAQIATQDQLIQNLNQQAGQAKLDLGPVNVRLDQVNHDLQIVTVNYQNAVNRLNAIARDRDNYLRDLIASIQYVNQQGGRMGIADGTSDGATLARRLGQDRGSRDGESDGLAQGTADGQARWYKQGAEQGERDGSARARVDGDRDGTNEGTRAGNNSAGNREGRIAGIKRGDASNAAQVGTDQGKKAGMDRAVRTGSIDGNNKGETETVQKYETGDLGSATINGPFAGSFSRRSPDYPGDFNGPSYNPNVSNSKDILRKAYADGYVDQYRQYTRYEFQRRIDGEYNASYDSRYAYSYDQANRREYPDYYDQGRRAADANAYGRDYPVIKAQAYRVAFERFDANPSRSSAEYTGAYKSSELSAYNERYEQIRRANFDRAEGDTFNANIAAQTEIYRQRRISEVATVYNNNAVLDFVSSEMLDGGISGVAKLDGVFQPGEATLHSLVIRNFGHKAAENVQVALDNGSLVKLPSIPARSVVKVVGAGLSKIPANAAIGSTARSSLKVVSKLTSDDAVEAIHFDSIGDSVLKSADQKQVRVAYPLALSNLSLASQLLKGQTNKLSVAVSNQSKRAYTGELKVTVLVNSQSQILTKEFASISGLQSSAQLSDAEVLVTEEKDVYRDLSFSASISQNGVLLGVLGTDLSAMAKAQYLDKAGAPVLVANSDRNLTALLDALDTLGGTGNVSVLDLSLANLNAATLSKGLDKKVILVSDDGRGSNTATLNTFIGKSKSSSFLFIDENNSGLKVAQSLGIAKDAQKLSFDKKLVVFTNPHRASGVDKSSALIQSSLAGFTADLELATNLTLSATDLIARMKTEINRSSFFAPSNTIKTFNLKALAEVLCINKAYDESGSIFSRDKKWVEMVANDNTLFINTMKSATAGDVTEEKLSVILPAIAMKDTVSAAMSDSYEISKAMMSKISSATNKVLDNMEDGFKKNLKNFSKDLYNKSYEKASIHRPFYIEPKTDPTN